MKNLYKNRISLIFEKKIMAKKTFSEEAKNLFSSWKSEIEVRDADIIERKRKRDEADAQFDEELKQLFHEVIVDVNQKAQKAIDITIREFKAFSEAVKEGTADIYKKLEIEKHLSQLSDFLNKIKSKGAESFVKMSEKMKTKMAEYDTELISEKQEDKNLANSGEEIETLIKLAEQEYTLSKK
jgi:hypothetical protein